MIAVEQSPQDSSHPLTAPGHPLHLTVALAQVLNLELQNESSKVLNSLNLLGLAGVDEFGGCVEG
jgi:hypothetical protein